MNSEVSSNSEDDQPQSKIGFSQIGTVVSIDNIPDEIKKLNQWVLWIGELNDRGKIVKPPYRADDPYAHASIDKAGTFSSFERAINSLIEYEDYLLGITAARGCPGAFGICIALTEKDDYAGVDLDDVVDAETGEISTFAVDIIERLNSYTEWSPSGNGIRIFVKGKLPGKALNRRGSNGDSIEIYDTGHFLSVTGDVY